MGERIDPEDKQRLCDTAAYLVRNPLSLKKLVYLDGHKAVLYRSRGTGRWAKLRGPRPPRLARPHERPHPRPGAAPHALVCTHCGQRMQMIASLTDRVCIRRILDHLGLSTPPQDRPPPVREILRVAEHGEGWGVPAEWD